jgi:hypothetical protein
MYNDRTLLTSGKYKFVSLGRVPAEWLLKIYNQGGNAADPQLFEYVKNNIEKIRSRATGTNIIEPLKPTCDKITYATEALARAALRKIKTDERTHKKPQRVYECWRCSGWHLTSKDFNKEKPAQ